MITRSLSRNYRVGYGLAQGKSLTRILEELQDPAEGVKTAHVLLKLANSQNIEVPICQQVCLLLTKNNCHTPWHSAKITGKGIKNK